MKTKLFFIISIISLSAFFSSCTEEEVKPSNETVQKGGRALDEKDNENF